MLYHVLPVVLIAAWCPNFVTNVPLWLTSIHFYIWIHFFYFSSTLTFNYVQIIAQIFCTKLYLYIFSSNTIFYNLFKWEVLISNLTFIVKKNCRYNCFSIWSSVLISSNQIWIFMLLNKGCGFKFCLYLKKLTLLMS